MPPNLDQPKDFTAHLVHPVSLRREGQDPSFQLLPADTEVTIGVPNPILVLYTNPDGVTSPGINVLIGSRLETVPLTAVRLRTYS